MELAHFNYAARLSIKRKAVCKVIVKRVHFCKAMADKMSNAPIFFAAAQVSFNEVQGMEKYVNDIQDQMRAVKYSDFKRSEQKTVQVNVASPEASMQQTDTIRWHFTNFEKTAGFVLTQNSLFFQTTAYETSSELRANLIRGLKVVNSVVGLDYVQSIGIRTLDAVVPRKNESLSKYLTASLMGYSEVLSGKLGHALTECMVSKPDGVLVARAVILGSDTPGLGVPFDLYPIQLNLPTRFQSVKGCHAVLDNDRRQQDRFMFNLEEIDNRIISLKKDITEAFYAAITEEARKAWS